MVHSVEPILPFDLVEATFLIPKLNKPLSYVNLISTRTHQLEKRALDLAMIKDHVLKARYTSIAQFEKDNENIIKDYNFMSGSLVLVQNTRIVL